MDLKVRQGVKFHDGSDLTAEDVAFSMERLKKESIYKAIYAKVKEYQIKDRASLHLVFERFEPSFPRWMGFLASFVVPRAYFEKVGAEEFSRKPVGSGPYRVVSFTPGSTLVLEAFDGITDPTARVAEIFRGQTSRRGAGEIRAPGLPAQPEAATAGPTWRRCPRAEPFRRKSAPGRPPRHLKTLVEKVLLGFGLPMATTEGPLYDAHDPSESFAYDPARARQLLQKAGYSTANPLKLDVMTTRGVRAKDFEVMTAIAQMWKDVGIEAELEVITIPQWFQYRSNRTGQGKGIAPLSLYFWSNASGDPINSIGFQLNVKGPFRVWESPDLVPLIDPVFEEKDEPKRIAAARRAARYAVDKGYIIPLYQVVQPVVMKKDLSYQPFPTGVLVPQEMS
jgi:peptide/nickel transport system substrate-binding protein